MLRLFQQLALALVVVVVGVAAVVFDNYDPADLPYCAPGWVCEDVACEGDDDAGNATTTTAAELVGLYQYATGVETDGGDGLTNWFHQDVLCACNRIREDVTQWTDSRPLRVVADVLCRIPQSSVGTGPLVATPAPSCDALGVGEKKTVVTTATATETMKMTGCHEYCNEVVFADVVERLYNVLGVGSAHRSSSLGYYCECRFGNATLRVCQDDPSTDNDDAARPEAGGGTDSGGGARSGAAGDRVGFPVAAAVVAIAAAAGAIAGL